MKLRLFRNSIRLRLSQDEFTKLSNNESVVDTTQFSPSNGLHVELRIMPVCSIVAEFQEKCIAVTIPRELMRTWAAGEDAGIEHLQPIDETQSLHILIEKDFECLDDPSANHAGLSLFPNPKRSCAPSN